MESVVCLCRKQLLFLTPDGHNFWDNFVGHVEQFKEDCKNLSPETLVRLTQDPSRRSCPVLINLTLPNMFLVLNFVCSFHGLFCCFIS